MRKRIDIMPQIFFQEVKFPEKKENMKKILLACFVVFVATEKVALVSFPNSGTTWIKFLYEGITGLQSGSVYKEPEGIIPSSRDPKPLGAPEFIKDHYPYQDAGLQHWFNPKLERPEHYAQRIVKVKRKKENNIAARIRYDARLANRTKEMEKEYDIWHEYWNNCTKCVFLNVTYENLLQDPMKEMKRIIFFVMNKTKLSPDLYWSDYQALYMTLIVYPPSFSWK